MKKFIFIVAIALCSCSEDTPAPSTGCLTGIPDGGSTRVLIRCCTREQYLAGNNVQHGGTASWDEYIEHKWEVCSSCK